MNALLKIAPIALLAVGCASMEEFRNTRFGKLTPERSSNHHEWPIFANGRSTPMSADESASSATIPELISPLPISEPSSPSLGPTLIQPAGGGAPVLALPLGGSLYLPVTGEAPVVGIALAP